MREREREKEREREWVREMDAWKYTIEAPDTSKDKKGG